MFKFGLAGYPVKHSRSPEIFEAIFKLAGAKGSYELFEIPDEATFIKFIREKLPELDGLNVTIPYKQIAASIADTKDDYAYASEAANLLYVRDGLVYAHNTDVLGFIQSLDNFKPKSAAVIGTGGAARAVVVALDRIGTERIYVHSRSEEKLKDFIDSLSPKLKAKLHDVKNLKEQLDLVVNASPAGMHPEIDKLPAGWHLIRNLRKNGLAYDLIYNPPKTKFLREAEQLPIKTMNGLRMLILQAAAAFKIVSGCTVDEKSLIQEFEAK